MLDTVNNLANLYDRQSKLGADEVLKVLPFPPSFWSYPGPLVFLFVSFPYSAGWMIYLNLYYSHLYFS